MKLKIILSVLLLFSLLKVDANPLVDISITSGKEEVFLHSNDIPFEIVIIDKAFREVLIKSMEDRIMLIPNDSSNNKFMYLISYRTNTDELPTDA